MIFAMAAADEARGNSTVPPVLECFKLLCLASVQAKRIGSEAHVTGLIAACKSFGLAKVSTVCQHM
jgi:hypothetical protein